MQWPPEELFRTDSVFCYAGDISFISEADLIVTSENTSLDLGSMSGTSVSGRIRKLAATKDTAGNIVSDNLGDYIRDWKLKARHYDNFNLGEVVFTPNTWAAKDNNIKSIGLAVAIRKKANGGAEFDASALVAIINKALNFANESGYKSIFFPIFGLGSAGISPEIAVSSTISALCAALKNRQSSFKIYLGVYRKNDQAELCYRLSEATIGS